MKTFALLVSVATLTIGCNRSGDLTLQERTVVEQEVRDMLGRYFDDIRKGGLTEEFKYLDDSDDFFWVPPGYTSPLSFDSVRATIIQNSDVFVSSDFSWEQLRVVPVANTVAAYTGIVTGTITDSSGTTTHSQIIETGIAVKREGGWKLLCGQSRTM